MINNKRTNTVQFLSSNEYIRKHASNTKHYDLKVPPTCFCTLRTIFRKFD